MSDMPPELLRRVIRAMGASRPDDVVEGVKEAVASGIRDVDPVASVRFTRYFNHSYNPDIIVRWSSDGEQERPVYLRGSLGDAAEANDFSRLEATAPIVIGLLDDTRKRRERVRPIAQQTRSVLTTQMSSIARLSEAKPKSTSLSRMVRSNLLREATGYLGAREAGRIISVSNDEPAESLRAFRDTVDQLFPGAAGARLGETAALLDSVINPDLIDQAEEYLLTHPLSESELALVLPLVLSSPEGAIDSRIWSALAPSLSLQKLESLSAVLGDHELTNLILPSLDRLHGSRARLEANANIAAEEEQSVAEIARWRMRHGLLTAEVGNQAVFISATGYYFRQKVDGIDARWEYLADNLDDFDVESVELHGLSDRLTVSGEDAERVRENVSTVRDAIHDDFHVPSIELRERAVEGAGVLRIDFSNSRVEHVRGVVGVRAFLLAAALMARGTPLPSWALEKLTGRAGGAQAANGLKS